MWGFSSLRGKLLHSLSWGEKSCSFVRKGGVALSAPRRKDRLRIQTYITDASHKINKVVSLTPCIYIWTFELFPCMCFNTCPDICGAAEERKTNKIKSNHRVRYTNAFVQNVQWSGCPCLTKDIQVLGARAKKCLIYVRWIPLLIHTLRLRLLYWNTYLGIPSNPCPCPGNQFSEGIKSV